MKKRLLALALCLVMAVSLLPITAAAEDTRVFKSVDIQGEVKEASSGSGSVYSVSIDGFKLCQEDGTIDNNAAGVWSYEITTDLEGAHKLTTPPKEGEMYYVVLFKIYDIYDRFGVQWYDPFSANLEIPGYKTELIKKINSTHSSNEPILYFTFRLTKEHEHDWQFKATGNTLTGTCGSCDIGEVRVTLKADSVTLPDSPFEAARLDGWDSFNAAFPSATAVFDYQYEGPGGGGFNPVADDPANAKAGTYQADVAISGLPGPVEQEGVATRAAAGNQDNNGHAYLWVKYTAADPKVTAQTGDSRPIEIMMVSVLAFSTLAAAAFALDSKRRYRR